jgi:uncharacterized protein YihD (DUF1040 family)
MRNPKRIQKVLKELEIIWNQNPDLRLCQLIVNVFGEENLYWLEEEELIINLKEYYAE